ncbi:MAG: hypothetical protein PVF22_05465 [Candidatus Aminicenantes bacterium]
MKKLLLIGLLVLLFILFMVSDIQARHRHCSASNSYLTISCFQKPKGVGLKQPLFGNIYVTGHLDYIDSVSDLEFQAGALYVFPHKIIIFRFYGGAGVQFSRNLGYQYPYIALGTNFLFFFTEVIHPMERDLESRYRFGFSFKF